MNELLVVGGIIVAALLLKKKPAAAASGTVYRDPKGNIVPPEKIVQVQQMFDTAKAEVDAKVAAMKKVIIPKINPFGEDITDIRRYQ